MKLPNRQDLISYHLVKRGMNWVAVFQYPNAVWEFDGSKWICV